MISLSPWRSGWANRFMPDGTPVWQDATYGNTPLVEAIRSIAGEVVDALFPTASLSIKSEYVENMINGVYSHPDRDVWGYNNPRQFDDYMSKMFPIWRTLPKYKAPSAAVVNAWSAAVNATQPLTGYNLIEGYKAPARQLPSIVSLSPWRSGWATRTLPNGTPVWQDVTYGNAPLVEALWDIAENIVPTVFPNRDETFLNNEMQYMVDGVYSHPDRDAWGYNNPRQFDDYVSRVLPIWRTYAGFVAPSASQIAFWSKIVNSVEPLTGYNLIEGSVKPVMTVPGTTPLPVTPLPPVPPVTPQKTWWGGRFRAEVTPLPPVPPVPPPAKQLPFIVPLTPWRSGWATRFMPDGTPVWQDVTYGNTALVEALWNIAENIVATVFPNRDVTFLNNEMQYMVDGIFSHPDRDAWGYNNPRQFDDYMTKVLPIWRTYAGFVAPSASQIAFWSLIVNTVEPLTGYNLIEGLIKPVMTVPGTTPLPVTPLPPVTPVGPIMTVPGTIPLPVTPVPPVRPIMTVPGTTPIPVTPARPIDIPTGFLVDPYETEKEASNSTVIILGAVVAYLLLKK